MPPMPPPKHPPPLLPQPTSLLEAVWISNIDDVRRLLREGADPNETDAAFGNTPLIRAALDGSLDMVSLLLDNGAKIDSWNMFGSTALTLVTSSYIVSRDAMIRLLVDRGADVNIKNGDGETAIDIAVKRSHPPEIINMMRQAAIKKNQLAEEFARAAEEKIRAAEEQKRATFSARQDLLKEIARKRPRPG